MKKCTAVVTYDSATNHIINIGLTDTKGLLINLKFSNLKGKCFQTLYTNVLKILKNNNYYVEKWTAFDAVWHNIVWADINDPGSLKRYPYFSENNGG